MVKKIELEYDEESDAIYIKINRGKIAESEEIYPNIIVDYDEAGRPLGIEIINYSKIKKELKLLEVVDTFVKMEENIKELIEL